MPNIFFTSDTHFRHAMMLRTRDFETIEAHDESIAESWNATVHKKDTVYHLGDLTLKNVKQIAPILERLNGTIILIQGNHDQNHPLNRGPARDHAYLESGISATNMSGAVNLGNGATALLSHFPYNGEGIRDMADRHVQWRLPDFGMPLIHGHTHDAGQGLSYSAKGTPMFHVGWDRWGAPVPREVVAKAFASA